MLSTLALCGSGGAKAPALARVVLLGAIRRSTAPSLARLGLPAAVRSGKVPSLARLALLAVIRAYQLLISAGLPPACRFEPTCSRYAYTAVERYGALRGGWLAVRRLLRCQPWGGGGYDPVP